MCTKEKLNITTFESLKHFLSFLYIPKNICLLGLIIFAIALITRWTVLFFGNVTTIDDPYICMRVARNIANGDGLVYNVGARVQSVTSPIYTLLWGGLWWLVGEKSLLVVRLLGGLADAAVAFWIVVLASGVTSFVRENQDTDTSEKEPVAANTPNLIGAAFAGVFYSCVSTCALVASWGLETGFYTLTIITTFWCLRIRRYALAAGLGSIAVLLRPDGVLLAAIVIVCITLHNRRIPFKELLIMVLIVAPYELFALLYYGTIIPQTITAKGLTIRFPIEQWTLFLNRFFTGSPKVWVIGASCLLGLGTIAWRHRYLLPVLAWSIVYVVFFSTLATWWSWYLPPAMIGYSLAVGVGVSVVITKLSILSKRVLIPVSSNRIGLITLTIMLVVLLSQTVRYARAKTGFGPEYMKQSQDLAQWVHSNTTDDATVMLEPLGLIGFLTNRKFQDYPGIASRAVTDSFRSFGRRIPAKPMDPLALKHVLSMVKPSILILREDEYEHNNNHGALAGYKVAYVSHIDHEITERYEQLQNMYILYRKDTLNYQLLKLGK